MVEFTSAGPWVVASQDEDHPFYLGSYMTGGKAYGGVGDPEWVNVIPAPQYLREYVFFTDPTYPETHLVVQGKIVESFIGATNWDQPEIRQRITDALAAAQADPS